MSLATASGFQVGSTEPIDTRLVLTKQQMKSVDENVMPDVYFANCIDDGLIYSFNKNNTVDEETGKFRKIESESVVELQEEPKIFENKIYNIKYENKEYQDLGTLDVEDRAGQFVGELFINNISPMKLDVDGVEYNITPTNEAQFLFGGETELPAIAYIIYSDGQRTRFLGLGNEEKHYTFRKILTEEKVSKVYSKDVKLLTETDISELEEVVDKKLSEVSEIKNLIPEQATTENKLADKNFVNSSIATNTAFFKGVFDNISKLPTEGVTNNDYAYVTSTDVAGNTIYARYKFNDESKEWKFEYNLNNTGFTAEQFAAINSGITAENYSGTSAKATADGNGNTISETYLPKNTNSDILPQFESSPSFLLGIEAFDNGGTVKWQTASNIKVGEATKADSANNGFNSSSVTDSVASWGTLTEANGYSNGRTYTFAGGGGITTAEKNNQFSMQVDGDLFVHEGLDKVEVVGHNHNGSYVSSLNLDTINTMAALKTYTNTSPAFCSSASINDGPAGNCWYNIQWIPHRNGIGGDNPNYGQLILYPMTLNSSKVYRYQKNNNTWSSVYTYDVSGNAESFIKGQINDENDNLNNYMKGGIWRVTANVSNLPPNMSNNFGQLLVMSGDNNSYPTQLFSIEGNDNNDFWYRKYEGDSWGGWVKLITSSQIYVSNGILYINV